MVRASFRSVGHLAVAAGTAFRSLGSPRYLWQLPHTVKWAGQNAANRQQYMEDAEHTSTEGRFDSSVLPT
jgi:hypothetical protein